MQIKNFPGYHIHDDGTVWSTRRKGPVTRLDGPPKQLKSHRLPSGYWYVVMRTSNTNSGYNSRHIHRLVLEAFRGQPLPGQMCRHLDGNKDNNHLSNLAWGTCLENKADSIRHGTIAVGERRGGDMKLVTAKVLAIRAEHSAGASYRTLATRYGISYGYAHRLLNGQYWKHLLPKNLPAKNLGSRAEAPIDDMDDGGGTPALPGLFP